MLPQNGPTLIREAQETALTMEAACSCLGNYVTSHSVRKYWNGGAEIVCLHVMMLMMLVCWVKIQKITENDLQIISHDRKVEMEGSK